LRLGVLQQVTARAGVQRPEHTGSVGEGSQHHDPRLRPRRDDLARRLDAVHPGHLEVHQHDLRLPLAGECHGLGAGAGRSRELDVGMAGESLLDALSARRRGRRRLTRGSRRRHLDA
jgi:hypothetical protein